MGRLKTCPHFRAAAHTFAESGRRFLEWPQVFNLRIPPPTPLPGQVENLPPLRERGQSLREHGESLTSREAERPQVLKVAAGFQSGRRFSTCGSPRQLRFLGRLKTCPHFGSEATAFMSRLKTCPHFRSEATVSECWQAVLAWPVPRENPRKEGS